MIFKCYPDTKDAFHNRTSPRETRWIRHCAVEPLSTTSQLPSPHHKLRDLHRFGVANTQKQCTILILTMKTLKLLRFYLPQFRHQFQWRLQPGNPEKGESWKDSNEELERITKSKDVSSETKAKIIHNLAVPITMYRCESWTVKKANRKRY